MDTKNPLTMSSGCTELKRSGVCLLFPPAVTMFLVKNLRTPTPRNRVFLRKDAL